MKKVVTNHIFRNNITNYVIREENGYVIIPVVMMIEGVHSGSMGPMLYTKEELANSASMWNGFPVVVNHPIDANGNPVSVENVDSTEIVGTISNSHMEEDKLKADLRINLVTLERLSLEMLSNIRENRPIDVSIGIKSNNELVQGTFNNLPYNGIVHDLRPDHLALLVDEEGACSWDTGCGIRNRKNNLLTINNMKNEKKVKIEETGVILTINGTSVELFGDLELLNNELGYRQIGRDIQQHLDGLDTSTTYYYLEEVFNDHFIYSVHSSQSKGTDFFKRNYQVNTSDELEITEDIVKVVKKVTFETVTNARIKMVRTNFNNSQTKTEGGQEMTKNEKSSPCKIDVVIANTANKFTEDDRKFLEELGDDNLDKFVIEKNPTEENSIENKKPTEVPEVTLEQIQAVFNKITDPVEFADKFMPEGMRESVKSGIRLNNEKREAFVKGIVANSTFTEANLKEWTTDDLEKMYDSVVEKEVESFNNYSGQGINRNNVENKSTEDLAVMLNIKTEEK